MDEINIQDFIKIDLRIAKVKQALEVPEAYCIQRIFAG